MLCVPVFDDDDDELIRWMEWARGAHNGRWIDGPSKQTVGAAEIDDNEDRILFCFVSFLLSWEELMLFLIGEIYSHLNEVLFVYF